MRFACRDDAGPRRSTLVLALGLGVGAVAVIALVAFVLWSTSQPEILQTISCPVHGPGQTPWPGLPEVCRW